VPAAATPYPSSIPVSGLVGTVTGVRVTLHGFHHLCAHDVDLLLVGPRGQQSILMSDAGDCETGPQQPAPVELAFDDGSAVGVPCLNGPANLLQSGLYSPTNDPTGPDTNCTNDGAHPDVFAAPVPAGPYALGLSAFNGYDPNGSWSLYAMDQFNTDDGAIDAGWSLDFTIPAGTLSSAPAIAGKPETGRTLTAVSGDLGAGAAAGYQWNRCSARGTGCRAISGATKKTRRATRADRGHRLTVTERGVTSSGMSAPLDSKATRIVGPALVSLHGTRRSQRGIARHGLRLSLRSNLAGSLAASAKLGRARLVPAHRRLRAGKRVRLRLRLTAKARAAIAGGARKARVRLVVTDANHVRSTTRVTIRLRR
jgi:hypothetical protein